MRRRLRAAAAVIAALAAVSAAGVAQGQETPTPAGAPAAPSNIQFNLGEGQFSWTDNSSDEDGFRVTLSTFATGSVEVYREDHVTAANDTSVRARSVAQLNDGDLLSVTVVAFNGSGESAPARLAVSLEGGLIPRTPTARPAALPGTGSGAASGGFPVPLLAALVLLFALSLSALRVSARRIR